MFKMNKYKSTSWIFCFELHLCANAVLTRDLDLQIPPKGPPAFYLYFVYYIEINECRVN